MRLALGCLLLALPALAQLDSVALRAKFGAPLTRETYHLPQEFDLTVDYNTENQVCKLGRSGRDARTTERFQPVQPAKANARISRGLGARFRARQGNP
jgi:hypothetical protein